jgi:hypothetical protein
MRRLVATRLCHKPERSRSEPVSQPTQLMPELSSREATRDTRHPIRDGAWPESRSTLLSARTYNSKATTICRYFTWT